MYFQLNTTNHLEIPKKNKNRMRKHLHYKIIDYNEKNNEMDFYLQLFIFFLLLMKFYIFNLKDSIKCCN